MEAEDGDVTLFGTKVSDMQEDVVVGDDEIVGTLKYLDSGDLVTTWGAGNFMALTFIDNDFSKYSSVKVGMDPSQSSGLVEIINDPDKNGVFKVMTVQSLATIVTLPLNTLSEAEMLSQSLFPVKEFFNVAFI